MRTRPRRRIRRGGGRAQRETRDAAKPRLDSVKPVPRRPSGRRLPEPVPRHVTASARRRRLGWWRPSSGPLRTRGRRPTDQGAIPRARLVVGGPSVVSVRPRVRFEPQHGHPRPGHLASPAPPGAMANRAIDAGAVSSLPSPPSRSAGGPPVSEASEDREPRNRNIVKTFRLSPPRRAILSVPGGHGFPGAQGDRGWKVFASGAPASQSPAGRAASQAPCFRTRRSVRDAALSPKVRTILSSVVFQAKS